MFPITTPRMIADLLQILILLFIWKNWDSFEVVEGVYLNYIFSEKKQEYIQYGGD